MDVAVGCLPDNVINFVHFSMTLRPLTKHQATTKPQDGEGDLINSICNTFDIDFETRYTRATKCHTAMNKEKHKHWKPPKGFNTMPWRHLTHDGRQS
jgi:hypothetical protein